MNPESLPVTVLKGVGPRLQARLARLQIHTVQDILFHLPHRYQDRTRVAPIGGLRPGEEAVISGVIELSDVVYRGRRSLIVRISDGSGHLSLRFFHFSAAQQKQLQRGRRLRCYGVARPGRDGMEMIHPEYEYLLEDEPAVEDRLTPVYPLTEGVHQLTLRKLARQALERYAGEIPEWLPESVREEHGLCPIGEALNGVHRPPPGEDVGRLLEGKHPLQARLAFEELLATQLSLERLRAEKQKQEAPVFKMDGGVYRSLVQGLPFALTGAQQRVVAEIREDLMQRHPMQRLVQGDVGSGKTVVAAIAAAFAMEAGYQVAVMAPTELLAEQHLKNFRDWFQPLGRQVLGLSGKLGTRARRQTLELLARHELDLVVGTHALFQEEVAFARLGLLVVDEQHRFGVHQRLALREKGTQGGVYPHQLIMTATPIPRTLAQTVYADLNVSVIDELPPGRRPVQTVAIPATRRAEVVQRVHAACREGRQAYWVCPLIEESEALQLQTAVDTEAALRQALPDLRIGLAHGRMKAREKDRIMAEFKAGALDLLVATTVIEVGVDVPRASLMIIENAERLGLSQLHQLRGRVGRGSERSSCLLMYQPPLSPYARRRLAAMRETSDGFEIARRDLELRGPGEMLGTRQTGLPRFRMADLIRDQHLIPAVQAAARRILQQHPDHIEPIVRRWLGRAEEYGNV